MEHLSTSSTSAEIKGRAKFIAKRIRDVQFAAFCHFLADMFSILGKLSLKMQSDDLILPVAGSQLKETVASITCLKSRHVPNGYFMLILGRTHKDAELIDFGNGNIERLINWFEPALKMAGCQVDDILPQWRSMKITFNSQFVEDVLVKRSIQVRS